VIRSQERIGVKHRSERPVVACGPEVSWRARRLEERVRNCHCKRRDWFPGVVCSPGAEGAAYRVIRIRSENDGDSVMGVAEKRGVGSGSREKRKLRVLFVGSEDVPGGVTTYVNTLVRECDSSTYEIHMTVSRLNEEHCVDLPRSRKHELELGYDVVTVLKRSLELRGIIRALGVDVIHMHTARGGLLGCLSTIGLPVGKVYTGHSWRFEQKTGAIVRGMFRQIEKFICGRSDVVACLTQRDEATGIRERFFEKDKSRIIRTRIDSPPRATTNAKGKAREILRIPPEARIIGCVGYLSLRKDPLTFIRAGASLVAERRDTYLVWVGDGDMRADVEELASDLGVFNNCRITGFVPLREALDMLATFDVFLFTSRIEGVPMTILEAQAAGIPVVSSNYIGSGVEELIAHDETGFVFPIGNHTVAAKQVAALLDDPCLRSQIAKAALHAFRKYHSDARLMAVEYENAYMTTLSSRLPCRK
jgi:glycosyltransferase involved in cell wall biosynthesis